MNSVTFVRNGLITTPIVNGIGPRFINNGGRALSAAKPVDASGSRWAKVALTLISVPVSDYPTISACRIVSIRQLGRSI